MNNSNATIIYPNLKAAAAAVCQRWCEEQGYSDRFLMQSLQRVTDHGAYKSRSKATGTAPPQRAASLRARW